MRSIKTKLILSYSILVLFVTLIIGLISLKIGYDAIQKEAKNSLMLLSAESAKLVENRMEALLGTIDMISKKNEIQNMGWDVDLKTLKEELEKTKFTDIGFVLPNGYTYYTDGTVRLMSDRSYIKAALGGKAEISDVVISRVTRKPEIEVSVPVLNDEQVVGALVARMEADSLSEITTDIGYGENGYAFIINEDGTIIAHPDVKKVLAGYNPSKELKDNPKLSSMVNAFQNIINGEFGVETYNDENRSMYAGFAPIEGTGWSFIITADQDEVMSSIPKMIRAILTVTLIILGGSLGVVYLLDSSMIKPLLEITKHSKCVSELDIRENISSTILKQKDEIGTLSGAFQILTENLREIITELIKSANKVSDTAMELTVTSQQSASVSEDITHTVEEISQGAYEQARNIESGLLQASLLNQKIEINHQHMINLNVTTEQVNEVVKEGLKDIDRLITITNENDMATKSICDVIMQMKESSKQIGDTSRVISEISKQTNLLSLNAAIEAARAGEAGKGFSIVAEEIQRLADQSAKSIKYINGIVAGLQDKITKSVESMELMSITSKEQHKSISDSIIKYHDISAAMKISEKAVKELNNSEKDMETANNEIKCMLQALSAIAEQNAVGTQQTVSTMEEQTASTQIIADVSERLNQLAKDLRITVSKFKV